MKNINYIDLGAHFGQEIDLFLKQFNNSNDVNIRIYGIEAKLSNYELLVEKYKDHKNINIFQYAINDKNVDLNLYHSTSNLGHSIFSTKYNVTDKCEIVKGVTFNNFIKNNVHEFESSYNILKMNIEGAEMFVYEDMIQFDLLKHFNVLCGHPTHDVEKIKELDNSPRKQQYYDTIKKNNINFLYYCAEDNTSISRCVNLKELI